MNELTLRAVWSKARPVLRDAAAELLRATTLTHPAHAARGKLTIVTFHRVLPAAQLAQYPLPGIAVTPDELDYLLSVFQEHYTLGPLAAVAARHSTGERPHKPLLAVTFDDGQKDNLLYAAPVLNGRGVKATFYVVSDAIDHDLTLWHDRLGYVLRALSAAQHQRLCERLNIVDTTDQRDAAIVNAAKLLTPVQRTQLIEQLEEEVGGPKRPHWDGMMSWQELSKLAAQGHEIGSHSHTHPLLPAVSDDQLEHEVAGSKRHIEQKLGSAVLSFCYPNGDHDPRVVNAVRRAGYRHAVTTQYGLNSRSADALTLRRCDMQGRYARSAWGAYREAGLLLRLTGQLPGAH